MNYIDGRMPIEHKYGQGFRWYSDEDNTSRWSENINLIPKPYTFTENFKNKYPHLINIDFPQKTLKNS